MLALADMSVAPGPERDAVQKFLDDGGVLVRFAGARLAAGDDEFTPTTLRRGGRTLGGALSWDTPRHVAPFEKPSPFFGLPVARRGDRHAAGAGGPRGGPRREDLGAPRRRHALVTAARRGKGLIVLFHVTADTTWSNLPLSGLFVDMLRRVVQGPILRPICPPPPRRARASAQRPARPGATCRPKDTCNQSPAFGRLLGGGLAE